MDTDRNFKVTQRQDCKLKSPRAITGFFLHFLAIRSMRKLSESIRKNKSIGRMHVNIPSVQSDHNARITDPNSFTCCYDLPVWIFYVIRLFRSFTSRKVYRSDWKISAYILIGGLAVCKPSVEGVLHSHVQQFQYFLGRTRVFLQGNWILRQGR